MSRKFVVLKPFKDLTDKNHIYAAGDFYPREGAELDEVRAEDLANGHNARNEILIVEILVKEELKGEDPKKEEPEKKAKKPATKKK